jgi:hypothetical protein
VAAAIESEAWSTELMELGADLWLATSALAGDYQCAEAHLPRRAPAATPRPRPALPETFRQVMGSLFACLELHGPQWVPRASIEPLRTFGDVEESAAQAPGIEAAPLADAFRTGARDLAPVLSAVLEAATLARVQDAAAGDAIVSDDLWCTVVWEFAAAYHRGAMHRGHLVQALVPLYLGRAASFLAGASEASEALIEALGGRFESSRATLVERWRT